MARDSSGESGLYISTNEANLEKTEISLDEDTTWAETHPTGAEKDVQIDDATRLQNTNCTNEPNLEETCDSGFVARDSSGESEITNIKAHNCTNEAKLRCV